MEKFFHVKRAGSTVRTEVFAGVTTFMTMAYILMVNSGIFSEIPGVSYNAIYIATAISACIGTVLIGLLSNLPLAQAAALIYVGIMMMNSARNIDWLKTEEAVPAFMTLAMMPMTYNISYGIAFGVISYVLINMLTGRAGKIKAGTWVIAILFALMFFVTH